ncbi:Alpha-ketoglutarate-dependent sulfonate dioxygenase [Mycena sanguinolenta]|uniref:Alpha-ketoglutarate-dependent sulfonate dioxygenase n=1 Tax=Mycena sanguinolenta TaxID=230812 RepID=A0A8H7DGW6_9AGAR|nr:Alpha-ketoglutarate-dependent sulfonate dioxygenase [Mycena sanguinolenta]
MSATLTTTIMEPVSSLLSGTATKKEEATEEPYKYAHLMPVYSQDKYPPLEPFEHVDPGSRALSHANPRSFLDGGNVVELTPEFGSDVRGVNLATLTPDQKDQLALEVARRGVIVFRDQEDFIDRGAGFYQDWGRHFGRLHMHPTSGHPEGFPYIHLIYKDANSKYNDQGLTSIISPSSCNPPGLTTFFLLAQPKTGGDTLYSSQVLNFRSLSPVMQNFLRTLKAMHTGVDSLRATKGGARRREPIETVHPVVRRHPVTGVEALYVNKQFTRSIVGMKKEESDLLLNFLYDHIAKAGDHQARIKWEPMSMALWDNRVTAHTATVDFGHLKSRRHGARITPQAERPIPANASMKMDD